MAKPVSISLAALLWSAGMIHAAEPDAIATALAACAAMQERFAGTECAAAATGNRTYRVTIKAATPDAMRVVFMRSLDVADGLCRAGQRVELDQQLETSAGSRVVRWRIAPPECGIVMGDGSAGVESNAVKLF